MSIWDAGCAISTCTDRAPNLASVWGSNLPPGRDYTASVSEDILVFLCHSSGDKERVRQLYHQLTADGVRCWFDEEDLLPGQDWESEISKAIRRCRFVLACISNSSISKTGYVQKELRLALDVADEQPDGSIFLIPVRLEECEIPDRLKRLHAADLFKPEAYTRLRRALRPPVFNEDWQLIDLLPPPEPAVRGRPGREPAERRVYRRAPGDDRDGRAARTDNQTPHRP